MPTKKTRVSVPLSDKLYSRLEKDADDMGMSIPTYIAVILNNHYQSLETAQTAILDGVKSMLQPLIDKANEIDPNIVKEEVEKANQNLNGYKQGIFDKLIDDEK